MVVPFPCEARSGGGIARAKGGLQEREIDHVALGVAAAECVRDLPEGSEVAHDAR